MSCLFAHLANGFDGLTISRREHDLQIEDLASVYWTASRQKPTTFLPPSVSKTLCSADLQRILDHAVFFVSGTNSIIFPRSLGGTHLPLLRKVFGM
jgi:hypothetical protein